MFLDLTLVEEYCFLTWQYLTYLCNVTSFRPLQPGQCRTCLVSSFPFFLFYSWSNVTLLRCFKAYLFYFPFPCSSTVRIACQPPVYTSVFAVYLLIICPTGHFPPHPPTCPPSLWFIFLIHLLSCCPALDDRRGPELILCSPTRCPVLHTTIGKSADTDI